MCFFLKGECHFVFEPICLYQNVQSGSIKIHKPGSLRYCYHHPRRSVVLIMYMYKGYRAWISGMPWNEASLTCCCHQCSQLLAPDLTGCGFNMEISLVLKLDAILEQ